MPRRRPPPVPRPPPGAPARRPATGATSVLNRHLVDWAALEARRPGRRADLGHRPDLRGRRAHHRLRRSRCSARRRRAVEVDRVGQRLVRRRSPPRSTGWPSDRVQVHARDGEPRLRARQQPRPRRTRAATSWSSSTTTPRSPPGWLAPLRDGARATPDVLGAQPLLLYPTGTDPVGGHRVPDHPAGCRTRSSRGSRSRTPHGVDGLRFRALTGAALALRSRGRGGAARLRPGLHQRHGGRRPLPPAGRAPRRSLPGRRRRSPVVHHESRTPGRYDKHLANRAVYLDRWQRVVEPRDDAALWATRGLRGRRPRGRAGPARRAAAAAGSRGRCWSARPAQVRESPGCAGRSRTRRRPAPGGERWGDTHFAASLAAALREPGQEVVVDRRPGVGPRHRPPRRRRARAARAGPPRPEPRAGLAALGDLAPRRGDRRGGARLRPGARRRRAWAERRAREWGLPGRAAAPGHRPGALPPRRRRRRAAGTPVLFVGNSRRVLRPGRARRARGRPPAGGVRRPVVRAWSPTRWSRGRSIPNDELAAAYRSAGVVLNDHHDDMRDERVRLQPALRRGGQRRPGGHRRRCAGLAGLFGASVQVYETPTTWRRLATLPDPDAVFGDDAARRARRRAGPPRALLRRPRRAASSRSPARPGPRARGIVRTAVWRTLVHLDKRDGLSRRADGEGAGQRVGVGDAEQVALERVDRRVGDGGEDPLPSSRPGPGCRRGWRPGTAA